MIALAVHGIVRTRRVVRDAQRRRALVALRVASAIAAVLLATHPEVVVANVEKSRGTLAVLVDLSRSMTLPARSGTRVDAAADAAREIVARHKMARVFGLKNDIAPIAGGVLSKPLVADGETSPVVNGLTKFLRDQGGDIGSVILISDGADSFVTAAEVAQKSFSARVHVLPVGVDAKLRDDAIVGLEADPVGFLHQPLHVRVSLHSVGLSQHSVVVRLVSDGQTVAETTADLAAGGRGTVELSARLETLGRRAYSVVIAPGDGDAVPENNARGFLVSVKREKLRVLLVCGRPSWDERFLREFLKRHDALDLVSFFILRTNTDLTNATPSELSLIPFPTDELFREHLGSFDVVIFQNFDYAPYEVGRHLTAIREYVRRGGGFAMIGGDKSFASGDYANTPIGEALPVDVGPNLGDTSLIDGKFAVDIATDADTHPLLALRDSATQSRAAWSALSELDGLNQVVSVRPAARVLLQQHGEGHAPVLVAGDFGSGRSLAVLTDSMWRWGFTAGAQNGDTSDYERFWDRAMAWLAHDPEFEPARIRLESDRVGLGEEIRAHAVLRDARYVPLRGQGFAAHVVDESNTHELDLPLAPDANGEVGFAFHAPRKAGIHKITIQRQGTSTPIASEVFLVETGGNELAEVETNVALLDAIAKQSGGEVLTTASDVDGIDTAKRKILGTKTAAPFTHPLFVLLTFALFCAEWMLRRKEGLR